jgi:hypothetical protein
LFGTRELIVGFRELAARRLAIWASDGLVLRALVGRELKKRELLLTATGQRTHLTLSAYVLKPCFAAGLFYRVSALSGPRVAMQVEAAAIRPAVPGTHWKHSRRCKSGYPLGHDIIGNISDVVVPRSELS